MRKFTQWLVLALAMIVSLPAVAQTFVGGRTDFRDESIYFVMTTRFYDGDPMNNVLSWDKQDVQKSKNDPDWRGDFAGLIKKLDYIKALGFTAIWITPITQNASGEDYHGYHSMDFSSVDLRYESRKAWGSSEDVKFQTLIDECHKKGIKVVLDIVLNHTSNFGEAKLNPLFTRNQNIKNQATPAGALIPGDRLSNNYFGQTGAAQYAERFKFFKNPQYDTHNHYHHYGTGWNWDLPNRWWGQIAGDCVDLNTENDEVAKYLVECYGNFMAMGVDAFRIDTTGHIAPLTFNKQFIPQFVAKGEQYAGQRGKYSNCPATPFYMFGECCARYGGVIYRDQHNLSSHYYTWKSSDALLNQYNGSQSFWDTQSLNEGHDSPVGPMAICEQESASRGTSNNVFMQGGAYHPVDYSQASGFNVIDFPMHYNFNDAGSAIRIANEGDKYYNDASWNVVYVDSHDYAPGPNDDKRFTGGTEQWAENLALMFTFRGIPCIYYGSEIEFKAGKPIDVGGENNKTPRSESGRAYYGMYLEGNINIAANEFGKFTADGEVAKTLDSDLARHITRLNLIRMSVPALRRGQYTFEGCQANGGYAFKRATADSYALVAINGGATFTNCPAGNYVDLVTGNPVPNNNGTITIDAPKNKGQLRVIVKDWNGGKVGEDGKFIYGSSSVSKGKRAEVADPGTTQYYTADDVAGTPSVKFSPAGGSFRTETVTVTATLNGDATSGWYKVGNGSQVSLTPNSSKTFTIGEGMNYGESVTVSWLATDGDQTYTGNVTYKKVDPNAGITIYVTGKDGANISGTNLHAWNDGGNLTGEWPGKQLTDQTTLQDGRSYYYYTFDVESVNVIFNRNGAQTGDIKGITEDTYFEYDGGSNATKIQPVPQEPSVEFNPNGGSFKGTINVTATLKNATSGWYKIGNGSQVNFNGTTATFPLGANMQDNESVTVSWSATNAKNETKTGSKTFTKVPEGVTPPNPDVVTINGDYNLAYEGSKTKVYYWGGTSKPEWPGVAMQTATGSDGKTYHVAKVAEGTTNVIFNSNGDSDKTGDLDYKAGYIHNDNGATSTAVVFETGDVPPPPPSEGMTIYYDNSESNWSNVKVHYWGASESTWPGIDMAVDGNRYKVVIPSGSTGIVFNNGSGDQTVDGTPINNHKYMGRNDRNNENKRLLDDLGEDNSAVEAVLTDGEGQVIEYYNIQGMRVDDPTPGVYIMRRGNEVKRVIIH